MHRLIVTTAVLLACISGQAAAICTAPSRVSGANLTKLIEGNTVCATRGSERWQEQHRAGGQLWDYKRGPTDPIDPTKQVGTWSISMAMGGTVTYSYTGGPNFTYSVHDEGGGASYSFCSGGTEIVTGATFLSGSTSCP